MITIYKVTTEGDCEGRSVKTLGYCTGNPADIELYFQDQKAYSIQLDILNIKHIDPATVKTKAELLQRKKDIEQELQYIKQQL